MNKNVLKAAYWMGVVDADRVPDRATEKIAARLIADLDDDLHDDEIETLAWERLNGYDDL
jgi:hypothetical protein